MSLPDGDWCVEMVKRHPNGGGANVFRAYGYQTEAEAQRALMDWQKKVPGYQEARVRRVDEGELKT